MRKAKDGMRAHRGRRAIALGVALALALGIGGAGASAAGKAYRPVFYGYSNQIEYDNGRYGVDLRLMGATSGGVWYDHDKLPITVGGKRIDHDNPPESGALAKADFLKEGDKVTIYNANGKVATKTIGQPYVDGYVICEVNNHSARLATGNWIAVGGTKNAMPRLPKITTTATTAHSGNRITYSIDIDGDRKADALVLEFTEQARWASSQKVTVKGKTYAIPSSLAIYPDDGIWFMDLDGDGRLELVIMGATVYVVRLKDASAKIIHEMPWGDRGA